MSDPTLDIYATDLFVPRYRPLRSGDWDLRVADAVLCPGYWSGPRLVLGMAGLVRRGETWMSTSPMEIESQEIGVRLARGHVAVFGLGMGWATAATALRTEVTAVTVVERDPDVLDLHRRLDLFSQLPDGASAKIRIVEGDAFAWEPDRPVDLLMADIWLPLVSETRVEEVRRMQANVRAGAIYFWGQEMEIARRAAAMGIDLDAAGVERVIAATALPLVGPAYPGYAGLVEAAARRWLSGPAPRQAPGTSSAASPEVPVDDTARPSSSRTRPDATSASARG